MQQLNATQEVTVLTAEQVSQVGGGIGIGIGPVKPLDVKPQDMYGCTMSIEEHMDWTAREHDPVRGDSIHDYLGGPGLQ